MTFTVLDQYVPLWRW